MRFSPGEPIDNVQVNVMSCLIGHDLLQRVGLTIMTRSHIGGKISK